MKRACLLALSLCVFGLTATSTAQAAKADGPKAKFFAKYDKNHNGVIDAGEKEAILKDFAAKPDGELKRFDKNQDGKLSDEEIAAVKPPTGKKPVDAGEKKSDKAKKSEKSQKPEKESASQPPANTGK